MSFPVITFSFVAPYLGVFACVIGLWAASHIHGKKRAKKKLICSLRADCDKVVHSTHATTLGIPNELLGVAYYVILGSLYAGTIAVPELFVNAWVHYLIVLMTAIGVIFSLYLIALQLFVIHAWCTWCMLSAIATFTLFVALFGLPLQDFFTLLGVHRTPWIILHSLGFILGVGAATITDVFFFKFLKDHQISEEEKGTMETLSGVIWFGLAILLVSGLMLFLAEQARLSQSPKFLLKVVVVSVIVVNGFVLNLLVSPRMRQLSFEGTKPARHFRRLAFALGGISIISWYIAFILGSIRNLGDYSFSQGLIVFLAIIGMVVIGSQVFERMVVKKYHALPETPQG